MYERLMAAPLGDARRDVLLLGPRQVGKSTLLRSLRPDLAIDLASPATFREYASHPERLERELAAAPAATKTIFLDEVQKVPALLDAVQSIVDAKPKRFRFLLSGSSARKLRRGQANLLPGRVHVHQLHPLFARELGDEFTIDRALAHGMLPGIWSEGDAALRAADLRGYVDAYLREEVQAEAIVRNIGHYARLLDHVAAASGRILNAGSLAQDAGIRYETVRRYLEAMEDTLILIRVKAWSGSDRASLVAHPKLFLFDLGVRNALLRRPLARAHDDERGLLLEHFVAQELFGRRGTLWPEMELFHYRTKHGAEVDFILEAGRETWAVEVKAGANVARSDCSGIQSFAERARGRVRKIVVFLGTRPQRIDDVEVLPLARFLEELPS
jgi:predicted AAA+ superfamily ATPase